MVEDNIEGISDCGCTLFTQDCEEAFWYWKDALGARLNENYTEMWASFDMYRRHKYLKVRERPTAATF